MKRTLTRMISAVCTAALGIGCMAIGADAKVIEPEVVKTESWTTSYYIDDDMDTLYPYIQCEADIYNDGTIKLYMWNTHEWDGFATIKHNIIFHHSIPVSVTSPEASLILFNSAQDSYNLYKMIDDTVAQEKLKEIISYYPSTYEMIDSANVWGDLGASSNRGSSTQIPTLAKRIKSSDSTWSDYNNPFSLVHIMISNLALPELKVNTERSRCDYTFQPTSNTNFSADQVFHLYGHDITITPELLSGSITAEPQLTEQEQKIKALEEENAALKASLSAFDADADSLLTAADAQAVLNYYVAHLAGKTTGKVSDYAEYSKQKG